jgi:plasmid stabilization system protein ParE
VDIEENPRAAAAMIRRIRRRIGWLATPGLANMGRPGRDPGTRELVEPPYVIVYEVHEARDEIEILSIAHSAKRRERPST